MIKTENDIRDNAIRVSADETFDRCGRNIAHLMWKNQLEPASHCLQRIRKC